MSPSIGQQYLDGTYADKNPSLHVEDSPWKAKQILRMLARHDLRPKTVAEVGCGAGEILVQLSREMPDTRFAGFELSPYGYELCRQRENERVGFFNVDFLADERNFELVTCIDVFEHVDDYLGFLRKLRHKAESFIFHIPLDMSAQMVARGKPITRVRDEVGHLHYFSKDTALATLSDAGYSVQDWFYTPDGIEIPCSFNQRLLRLPRKIAYAMNPDVTVRVLGGYSLLVLATATAS